MVNSVVTVFFFVARLDHTSLMRLTKQISESLTLSTKTRYQVKIIEWRTTSFLKLYRLLNADSTKDNQKFVVSVGALADFFAATIKCISFNRRLRWVSWLHCHPFEDLRWERSFLFAAAYYFIWLIGLASKDSVVCVSKSVMDGLPFFIRRRANVIYNPVSMLPSNDKSNACSNELKNIWLWINKSRAENKSILISFGLFRKRKNFEQAIRVISLDNSLSMILFGSGPERDSLQKLAIELGVDSRVYFAPFINNPYSFCSYADVYVSNTHSEGFGLANIEAALTGIPTVVPSIPVNHEVMLPFDHIFYFKVGDDYDCLVNIKNAINSRRIQVLQNPYSAQRFEESWKYFLEDFN